MCLGTNDKNSKFRMDQLTDQQTDQLIDQHGDLLSCIPCNEKKKKIKKNKHNANIHRKADL